MDETWGNSSVNRLGLHSICSEEAAGERARRHRASNGFIPSKEDLYVM